MVSARFNNTYTHITIHCMIVHNMTIILFKLIVIAHDIFRISTILVHRRNTTYNHIRKLANNNTFLHKFMTYD
jgi:hypothetical protein